MIIKSGMQGTNYYLDPEIEKYRYNPYRKANRELAEMAYKENIHLPFPLHVIIETSSLCNLKCSFCNREVMTRPQMNMDMQTYKKIIDECAENHIYSVSLYCLGEPLMNPLLPEMITYAKRKGIAYVDISTNGMFPLTPLLGTGLNEIIISLDGFKTTHELNRKGAKYDQICENLEEFMDFRFSNDAFVRIQIIEDFVKGEEKDKFIQHWIKKADTVYLKKIEAFSQSLGDKNLSQDKINDRLSHRIPCKQLWFILTIDSDGTIEYCCHSPNGKAQLGNIEKTTLKDAWLKLGPIRNAHREGQYTEICNLCCDWSW